MYNSSMYYCYLYAHSEHYLKKDLLLVTFRDKRGVTIELEGGYRHISYDKFEKCFRRKTSCAGLFSDLNRYDNKILTEKYHLKEMFSCLHKLLNCKLCRSFLSPSGDV